MRYWTARQWWVSALSAVLLALGVGVLTGIVPNPYFVRLIATPWWGYPVWVVSSAMTGLLIGTYVAPGERRSRATNQRRTMWGSVLSWIAVGCPTCNKVVVLALGSSGAITWFEPLQPVLAVGALVLLGVALRSRLRNATSCPVPSGTRRKWRLTTPGRGR